MKKFHVAVPKIHAEADFRFLNQSVHSSYSDCTVLGENDELYAISFLAKSKQDAHVIYQDYCIQDTDDFVSDMPNKVATTPAPLITSSGLSKSPDFSFVGHSFIFTTPFGTTMDHDFLLPKKYAVKGGQIFVKDALIKDYVEVKMVDIDNVLGMGENTVIGNWIEKWHIAPSQLMTGMSENITVLPSSGLYMRLTYHSDKTATISPEGFLNLIMYEVS